MSTPQDHRAFYLSVSVIATTVIALYILWPHTYVLFPSIGTGPFVSFENLYFALATFQEIHGKSFLT